MNSLLANVKRWDDAFLPWRMSSDSFWLTTDISELRALVELQSMRAMKLTQAYYLETPNAAAPHRPEDLSD